MTSVCNCNLKDMINIKDYRKNMENGLESQSIPSITIIPPIPLLWIFFLNFSTSGLPFNYSKQTKKRNWNILTVQGQHQSASSIAVEKMSCLLFLPILKKNPVPHINVSLGPKFSNIQLKSSLWFLLLISTPCWSRIINPLLVSISSSTYILCPTPTSPKWPLSFHPGSPAG